jgi:hypothetical protein
LYLDAIANTIAHAVTNTIPNAIANTIAHAVTNTVPDAIANTVANTVTHANDNDHHDCRLFGGIG